MRGRDFAVFSAILIIAVAAIASVKSDDNEYHYLTICDSRCEIQHRLNPFAESCDNCCRMRGFKKGKCKGFGWQYCACKPHGPLRTLFNNMLNTHLNNNHQGQNHGYGLNNVFQG